MKIVNNMKSAVIFFHKNIKYIYKQIWVDKCLASIKSQTYQNFDIFELNYGDDGEKICNIFNNKTYFFYNKPLQNHVYAMNYLIDIVLSGGYDVIFMVHMDDYYHHDRFAKQIDEIEKGYQLVSSNFVYISEDINGVDNIDKYLNMVSHGDIKNNFDNGHNVISHPSVVTHKSFWDDDLRYDTNKIGYEDFDLWVRSMNNGKKFHIVNDYLLYYRNHYNQVSQLEKRGEL